MPGIVFYYRDGVSEGEYDKVRVDEGAAIEGGKVISCPP